MGCCSSVGSTTVVCPAHTGCVLLSSTNHARRAALLFLLLCLPCSITWRLCQPAMQVSWHLLVERLPAVMVAAALPAS